MQIGLNGYEMSYTTCTVLYYPERHGMADMHCMALYESGREEERDSSIKWYLLTIQSTCN